MRVASPVRSAFRDPVHRFFLYRFFVADGFVFPVVTLLLLDRGLTLGGVGLAAGSFFVGTLLGEVPTGYVGDRVGRRNGMALGSVLVVATHLGFSVASTLPVFVAVYGFWGVAATFRSGSTDAWLYDVLAARNDEHVFTRAKGRSTAAFYGSAAATALVGGWLYEIDPRYPFLAAAGFTAVSAAVCLSLPEPSAEHDPGGFAVGDAADALRDVAARPKVRAFLALVAVTTAVPETLDVFVQPISRDLGVRPSGLGPLYTALLLTAAGGSFAADRVRARVGTAAWFWVAPFALAVALGAAALVPVAAFPAFFAGRGLKSVTGTLASTHLNDRIASTGRATVLSAASMLYALTYTGARAVGGALADVAGALPALAAFGAAGVVLTTLVRVHTDPFE